MTSKLNLIKIQLINFGFGKHLKILRVFSDGYRSAQARECKSWEIKGKRVWLLALRNRWGQGEWSNRGWGHVRHVRKDKGEIRRFVATVGHCSTQSATERTFAAEHQLEAFTHLSSVQHFIQLSFQFLLYQKVFFDPTNPLEQPEYIAVTFELNALLDLSRQATTKSLSSLWTELLLQVLSESTGTVAVRVIRGDEGVGDIPGVRGDFKGRSEERAQ